MEQEMHYRRLNQEQLDAFTLDMNSAYARLKGIEEAIDSEFCIAVLLHAGFEIRVYRVHAITDLTNIYLYFYYWFKDA